MDRRINRVEYESTEIWKKISGLKTEVGTIYRESVEFRRQVGVDTRELTVFR